MIYNRDEKESTTASSPTLKTMSLILIEREMTSGTALQIHCNHSNMGLNCQGAKGKIEFISHRFYVALVCMHVCVWMCVQVCAHVCAGVYVCMVVCAHTCVCVCDYVRACLCVCVCNPKSSANITQTWPAFRVGPLWKPSQSCLCPLSLPGTGQSIVTQWPVNSQSMAGPQPVNDQSMASQ